MRRFVVILLIGLILAPSPLTSSHAHAYIDCAHWWTIPEEWRCEECTYQYRLGDGDQLHLLVYGADRTYTYLILGPDHAFTEYHPLWQVSEFNSMFLSLEPWDDRTTLFYSGFTLYRYDRQTGAVSFLTQGFPCANHVNIIPLAPTYDMMRINAHEVLFCDWRSLPRTDVLADRSPGELSLNAFNITAQSTTELAALLTFHGAASWIRAIAGADGRIYLQFSGETFRTYPDESLLVPTTGLDLSHADTVILATDLTTSTWEIASVLPPEIVYPGQSIAALDQLVAVDAEGAFFFIGYTFITEAREYRLTKIDPSGDILWRITQDDLNATYFRFIDVLPDGSILLAVTPAADNLPLEVLACTVN